MRRRLRALVVLAVLTAAVPPVAHAHGGNPNFRSVFQGMRPPLPGVRVRVLGYDAEYEIRVAARRPVTIFGYEDEPYVRLLPDGTVQQNVNSPATYLNADVDATTPVPARARRGAPVVWRTVDRTGRFVWHDHRMHYMGTGRPEQVRDEHERTKIFSYRIPVAEGSTRSAITGTLFWVGPSGEGFPVGAAIALVVLVIGGGALVAVTRRRRAATADDTTDEAW